MTTAKPKRKSKAAPANNDLLAAIEWVALAQKDEGAVYQTHCRIGQGWAVAFEGAIAAGARIPVDWFACPQTSRLRAALARSAEGMSIVVDEAAITIKSGRLTVRVPCVDVLPEEPAPDTSTTAADDDFLAQLARVLPVVKESATTVLESSVEIAQGTVTSTNRKVILQAWHGLDLPRFILPRAAAALLVKQKGLTAIGLGDATATFWFGPDRWFRANLYRAEDWPCVDKVLDVPHNAGPVPVGMKEGVEALLPHCDDESDYISASLACVKSNNASYAINEDAPTDEVKLKGEYLSLILQYATDIDFDAGLKVLFFGDRIRGALAHVVDR